MFNIENLLKTLPIMAKGMVGILLECLFIVLVMYLLTKFKDK